MATMSLGPHFEFASEGQGYVKVFAALALLLVACDIAQKAPSSKLQDSGVSG